MTNSLATVFLGPTIPRWKPESYHDVILAAAEGTLDETHWVELKQLIPPANKATNTELAKDLASLAPDGGVLIVGIKDDNSNAGAVLGVELAGLADRVDQIARGRIEPPLLVRSRELPDPDRPGYGCLLIEVPPSPQAPHMIDKRYWGRGDRGKTPLNDRQVRDLFDQRRAQEADFPELLRNLAGTSRIAVRPQHGHLSVLIRPAAHTPDALTDYLVHPDAISGLIELTSRLVARQAEDGRQQYSPAPANATRVDRHADGLRLSTVYRGEVIVESKLLDITIGRDGSVALTCGRATDSYSPGWRQVGADGRELLPQPFIFTELVMGLTFHAVLLAGALADTVSGYQGHWQAGVLVDGLEGLVGSEFRDDMMSDGTPYSRPEYRHIVSSTTAELVDEPHAVVWRLLRNLLFGLEVERRYQPTFDPKASS